MTFKSEFKNIKLFITFNIFITSIRGFQIPIKKLIENVLKNKLCVYYINEAIANIFTMYD